MAKKDTGVYRVTEVIGTSANSWEDAARNAVKTAAKSLRDLRIAEITKLDDQVIDSGPTLIGEIWTHQPGDVVKLTYTRDGKTNTAEVTLGQRDGDS